MNHPAILITGACGFLGSRMARHLADTGHPVVGIDDGSARGLPRGAFGFPDHLPLLITSITRPGPEMLEFARSHQVGLILHFAECKIPRYGSGLDALTVNVHGTRAILELATRLRCRVILGSTDEVYGKNTEGPLHEESASIVGRSDSNRWSYAVSKLMAEHLTLAYAESHGLPVTVIRYGAFYGPGETRDWRGGPVSVFIDRMLAGQPLPIHGDGLQVRAFGFIDDLVAGTAAVLASDGCDGEIINLGGHDATRIINLAYRIWRLAQGTGRPALEFVPYTDFSHRYEDVRSRVLDISKASALLGYRPVTALEEGIARTIAWHRETATG